MNKENDKDFNVLNPGCACDDQELEQDVVELIDEDGKPVRFVIIANLEVDDQEYAILANEEDEEEVVIFRVTEEDEEFVFETIEDQEELDAVVEAYGELLEELEEDEE